MEHVFLDTWAFIAQANQKDPWHAQAVAALDWLTNHGYLLATSTDVVDESVTGVCALLGGRAAVAFLDDLEAAVAGEELDLIALTPTRRAAAAEVFRRLAPSVHRLSLTDCSSFAIMTELTLRLALTADQHFTRAGGGIRPLFVREGDSLAFRPPHS